MTDQNEAARDEILLRLAHSRDELRVLLEPPPRAEPLGDGVSGNYAGGFPRSRTMQMLMSGTGLKTLGAVAGGLLIARPALALRLLRLLPASAFARTMLLRALTTWRAKRD